MCGLTKDGRPVGRCGRPVGGTYSEDGIDIGAWAVGLLTDFHDDAIEPGSVEVRYECVVELTTYDHDRSGRSRDTEALVFSEDTLEALYDAIEGDRLERKAGAYRIQHVYRYSQIRKVLVIADDEFDENRLASTEARRRHVEAETRRTAAAEAKLVADRERKEANDRRLYEDLRARFEGPGSQQD